MRRLTPILLWALWSCGNDAAPKPEPKVDPSPKAAAPDAAPAPPPDPDASILDAKSTRCVFARFADNGSELARLVELDFPSRVLRVAYHAQTQPPPSSEAERLHRLRVRASALAWRGELDASRAAIAELGVDDPDPRDARILVGLPTVAPYELEHVPALVRVGRRDEALAAYRATEKPGDSFADERARALVALELESELPSVRDAVAGQELERQGFYVAWAAAALEHGRGIEPALAALTAARNKDPNFDEQIVAKVIDRASIHDRAADVAPLARKIRATTKQRIVLISLLDEAHARHDDAEVAALETEISKRLGWYSSMFPLVRALHRGTIEEALAAIDAYQGASKEMTEDVRTEAMARLWARHVTAGFDPATEALLAARWCAP